MAKSKLVAANRKIAEHVVGGYNRIANAFVDQYLTKEGESVEDARKRLSEEANERQEAKVTKETEMKNKIEKINQ